MSEQPVSSVTESDAPDCRRSDLAPLRVAVETAAGSDQYVFEPRMRVTQLTLSCDDKISQATIDVFTGEVFETARDAAAAEVKPAVFLDGKSGGATAAAICPDRRIIIYLDQDDESEPRRIVFSGFCDAGSYTLKGSGLAGTITASMTVSSVLERLSKQPHAIIAGRYVRTPASYDEWKAAFESEPKGKLTAVGDEGDVMLVHRPCTFNARGEANRSPAPIMVQVGDEERKVYVFTHDNDPDAEAWTWAQALRYLVYFHGYQLDEEGAFIGLLDGGNVFFQTKDYASSTVDSRPAPPVEEVAGFDGTTPSRMLEYALLALPCDAVFEGMNFVEALAVLAKQTQSHFRLQTDTASGMPFENLMFYARGSGPRRTVSFSAPTAAEIAQLSDAEILARLNIHDYSLGADYGDVLTDVIVHGDIRRYEITAELVPGWKPDDHIDCVASVETETQFATAHIGLSGDDRAADPWYQRYCPNGVQFSYFSNVGRRWVLNETGRYLAAVFGRASGAFTADLYAPWEPSDSAITDSVVAVDGTVSRVYVDSGEWARLSRPLMPCFSADANKRSYGVVVEVTFDNGSHWVRCEAKVLNTECGVYFEQDDLVALAFKEFEDTNFWEAGINGNLRVRVTGVIEGDNHLDATLPDPVAAGTAAIAHHQARRFDFSDRLVSNRRDGGNSQFKVGGEAAAPGETFEARDDAVLIQRIAQAVADLHSTRQLPASFSVPWLEFWRYWVGDVVTGVDGLGVEFHGAPSGGLRRPPDIIELVYGGDGTQIVLETPDLADPLAGLV